MTKVKLELEFNRPPPEQMREYDIFMTTKQIVRVSLHASDGAIFNVHLAQPQTQQKVGNGPFVPLKRQ